MPAFELNEYIDRSPQEVFNFTTASENAPKVIPSVTDMVKLTEGPTRVGTRYRETRLIEDEEHQTELEIVEYEPVQKYAMRNETDGIETIYWYTFHPEDDGTRVHLKCEVKGKGLKKLVAPVVVSVLRKEDGDHLQLLKKALEA